MSEPKVYHQQEAFFRFAAQLLLQASNNIDRACEILLEEHAAPTLSRSRLRIEDDLEVPQVPEVPQEASRPAASPVANPVPKLLESTAALQDGSPTPNSVASKPVKSKTVESKTVESKDAKSKKDKSKKVVVAKPAADCREMTKYGAMPTTTQCGVKRKRKAEDALPLAPNPVKRKKASRGGSKSTRIN